MYTRAFIEFGERTLVEKLRVFNAPETEIFFFFSRIPTQRSAAAADAVFPLLWYDKFFPFFRAFFLLSPSFGRNNAGRAYGSFEKRRIRLENVVPLSSGR